MENKPTARKSDLVIQESKEELLVYDLITNKAKCLNETSAAIWSLCDGEKSVSDIAQKCAETLGKSFPEDVVLLAVDQLRKEELLSEETEISFDLDRTSRREIIKKIGFASAVALPSIASIVAPLASQAQSGLMNLSFGDSCSGDSQCTSNNCGSRDSVCCVSTSGHNRTPGSSYGSSFNVQNCASNASFLCCSGSGFWKGTSTTFPSGTVSYNCECN